MTLEVRETPTGWWILEGFPYETRKKYQEHLGVSSRVVGDVIKFKMSNHARRFLESKGVKVPSSQFNDNTLVDIEKIYSITQPYEHQIDLFNKIKDLQYFGVEWEMGLGKTKLAIDIALHKYNKGEIDTVVIVAPKGVHNNWIYSQIPAHVENSEGTKYIARSWDNSKKDYGTNGILEFKKLVFFAINYNAIITAVGNNYLNALLKNKKVFLILDESHWIKTPDSSRTKELHRLCELSVCRLIMTGTAMTNSPLDLWGQYRFLSSDIIFENYFIFKNKYAIFKQVSYGGRSYYELVGYRNLEGLKDRLAPHRSVISKKDVLNLPDKIYMTREYELDKVTRKLYDSMLKDYVSLIDTDVVSVQIALTRILRLQQFCCGFFVSDETNETKSIKESERISILLEVIEEIMLSDPTSKVIIWSTFRKSIFDINENLSNKYGKDSCATYFGDTSSDERQSIINKFQDPSNSLKFFIGNPQSGGTGITLTQANYVIYYNNSFNLAERLQSEDRAHRIGQNRNVTYIDIIASNTVDSKILCALKSKTDLATLIGSGNFKNWLTNNVDKNII